MKIQRVRQIIFEEIYNFLDEAKRKFIPKAWQTNPTSIETEKVQYWSESGVMLTGRMKKKDAQKLVKQGKAFVISGQAIGALTEQGDKEKQKAAKEKQDIAQQKTDIAQQKLDFSKQQAADTDREADQRDAEKEKEDKEKEAGAEQQKEPEKKPNISFKSQGQFYEDAYPELRNLVLSNGNLLDDDERKYVALAVQAAEGRIDKGFEKFLRKGRAGNVYGKDFSGEDIQKIIEYCKKHELVR